MVGERSHLLLGLLYEELKAGNVHDSANAVPTLGDDQPIGVAAGYHFQYLGDQRTHALDD